MPENSVSLKDVTKRYGHFTAVNNLSFDVAKGEIYGFLGPNGAGKTTTLRMMLDIIKPTEGAVTVLGSNSAISVRQRIGYLPEERGLYRKMKAAESIAYFAQLRGLTRSRAKQRAHELLEQFGLEKFAKSKNEALSKGMAQKVQLLATIAHEPELLILDEPFSGLDPINQQTLEELIREQRNNGRTIIFSTHVMQHAERLCDRFLILADGEKRFEGTLAEARDQLTRRIHIRSNSRADKLEKIPGVAAVHIENSAGGDDGVSYEIELTNDADPQAFLKNALSAGVDLSRYEQAGATLHDIFVTLAGAAAADDDLPVREAAE